MDASAILPDHVPVMPLPGALLFPHALLPLYIFEPRYREMLEHALNHHRMLSVALVTKVLRLYSKLKADGRQLPAKVDRYLSDLEAPEMLVDLVASTFISDPLRRQRVLEELSVNQRLRLVIQYLGEESGSAAA